MASCRHSPRCCSKVWPTPSSSTRSAGGSTTRIRSPATPIGRTGRRSGRSCGRTVGWLPSPSRASASMTTRGCEQRSRMGSSWSWLRRSRPPTTRPSGGASTRSPAPRWGSANVAGDNHHRGVLLAPGSVRPCGCPVGPAAVAVQEVATFSHRGRAGRGLRGHRVGWEPLSAASRAGLPVGSAQDGARTRISIAPVLPPVEAATSKRSTCAVTSPGAMAWSTGKGP